MKSNEYKDKLISLIGKEVSGHIDRLLGSHHPHHKNILYTVNYGYIFDLIAPDGEEQDAYYLGVNPPIKEFAGIVIAIVERIDDKEDKLIVVPKGMNFTDEEIEEQIYFQEQYFKHRIRRA